MALLAASLSTLSRAAPTLFSRQREETRCEDRTKTPVLPERLEQPEEVQSVSAA